MWSIAPVGRLGIVLSLAALAALVALSGIRFIPNNRVGIVEKRFSLRGSVKRGLIAPSLQLSRGTGTPNIFSREDAVKIKVIADLRQAGISFNVLAATLERLDQHPTALADGAMVLVNGTVSVVDEAEASTAIAHGSLTLVYNVGHAIKMIEATLNDANR